MKNLIFIILLIPFLFAGTFQSYTEKTTPEASDIFLILDNDDLTTKKVQVGNIGDGINWYTTNINSDGINWTSLDQDIQSEGINWTSLNQDIQRSNINWSSLNQDIQTGGVNWTSLNEVIQKGNVNWTSLNDSIQTAGMNWDSLNNDIQQTGINWTSANLYIDSTNGYVGVGVSNPLKRFQVGTNTVTVTDSMDALSLGGKISSAAGQYPKLILFENASGANQYGIGVSSFAIDYISPTSSAHNFYANGLPAMKIESGGNVGIGTLTAKAQLHVDQIDAGDSFRVNDILEDSSPFLINSAGNVGIGTLFPKAKFVVFPEAVQTIAAGNTITANSCGSVKEINAASSVTTDTTNTFTAITTGYQGCCMRVVNVDDTDTITLDNNANTFTNGAADVALGPGDSAEFCASLNSAVWYQIGATGNN